MLQNIFEFLKQELFQFIKPLSAILIGYFNMFHLEPSRPSHNSLLYVLQVSPLCYQNYTTIFIVYI